MKIFKKLIDRAFKINEFKTISVVEVDVLEEEEVLRKIAEIELKASKELEAQIQKEVQLIIKNVKEAGYLENVVIELYVKVRRLENKNEKLEKAK